MSREPVIDPRKLGAGALLLGASGLVVALFLWMVGPAAAREVQAACNGMRPTWSSKAFKRLPAKAPDFTLKDVDGNDVTLSSLRGKVVLVNFWASWCGVCKAEKPSLAALAREYEREGLVVVTVASDEELGPVDESMRTALQKRGEKLEDMPKWGGAPFEILLDPPNEENIGPVARSWGVEKVPDSFLIDRAGNIRMYLVNKRDWDSGVVETCVQSLIDE